MSPPRARKLWPATVLLATQFACSSAPTIPYDSAKAAETDRGFISVPLRQGGFAVSQFDVASDLKSDSETAPLINGFWTYSISAVVLAGAGCGFLAGANAQNSGVLIGLSLFGAAFGVNSFARQKMIDAVETRNRQLERPRPVDKPSSRIQPLLFPIANGAALATRIEF